MKFSDILKTIGLTNGNLSNSTTNHKIGNNSYFGENIDRIYNTGIYRPQHNRHISHQYGHNPYQSYHQYNYPHGQHQMDIPTNNGYYYSSPSYMYNSHDIGAGYGIRYGAASETGHAQTQMGTGYEHTGYDINDPTGGGGHNQQHHQHVPSPIHTVPIHPQSSYDYQPSKSRSKSKGSSTLTALTLLSFFFFINLLQNCLKEHMDAMNPTVMVMTAGVARNRVNKLTDVNSRETTENDGIIIEDGKFTEHPRDDDQQKNQTIFNRTQYSPTTLIVNGEFPMRDDEKLHTTKFINNKNDYFRENDRQYFKIN